MSADCKSAGTEVEATATPQNLVTDYCGEFMYEDGDLVCIFAPFGRIRPMATEQGTRWRTYYSLTDHLGNVRAEFVAHDSGQPELVQQTDYYPFGYTLRRNDFGSQHPNRRLFGGKELQPETLAGNTLDWYDFEARMYDPLIGRFMTADPLSEKYYLITPYGYCGNNPMNAIDLNGLDPIYAKNFWGKVHKIGDDGKNGMGAYLVSGQIVKEVKAAQKNGEYYSGDLSDCAYVMHIPTGNILQDIRKTVMATYESGNTTEDRVENGGHTLIGDEYARIWDSGGKVKKTIEDGQVQQQWSIIPFMIDGKINVGGKSENIKDVWHIHPNKSAPSQRDIKEVSKWREAGYKGNPFVVGINESTVSFYNEKGELEKVTYNEFLKMGRQEDF